MSDQLINQAIGGCTILEVIGQGGMGVIYKGRQKSLDRVVAVKVLAPHLANDANFVTRFQKEARSIARVNHPHILAVYDVGTDQNVNYMIMELIEGESLAELQAEKRGALDWREATEFIRQSAQGLEAAQAAGIIHRDIKPENLMVTRKGQIKVSDFGLAKESDGTGTQTSVDSVMGTPAFMSPEQCDGKKVDGRSDIYSLGGTWYRLITGRLPFEAETAMSTMYRHKHEALIPPNEVLPTIPRPISDVIVKMMAKKRDHRYQTFTEVIEAIEQAIKRTEEMDAGGGDAQYGGDQSGQQSAYDTNPLSMTTAASRFAAGPQATDYGRPAGQFGVPGAQQPSGLNQPLQPGTGSGMTGAMRRGIANVARGPIPGLGGGFMPGGQESRFNTGAQQALPGMPSMPMAGLGGLDEGYANVSRGDEMMERADRVNAVKAYIQALQSNMLDNATRARLEQTVGQEITVRRQSADSMLKRGMLVDAQRECRVLSEMDPNDEGIKALLKDIESRLALKRTLVNDIRNAIAASQFEGAIKIWDGTPPELRDEGLGKQIEQLRIIVVPAAKLAEQGETFIQQGRLEEAIATYEDALKINPSCEQARQGLKDSEAKLARIDFLMKEGYQYNLEQNYEKAIDTWRPILNLRPGHPQALKSIVEAYIQYGQTLRAQGDLEGALNKYRGARETDPGNRTVARMTDEIALLRDKEKQLLERAQDAEAKGRLGEAIHCWKDMYALNPNNRKAQQKIALIAKRRSSNAALTFTVVVLVVAASICGYKYLEERSLMEKARGLCSAGKYGEASTLLKKSTFLFFPAEVKKLKDDADDEFEIQTADSHAKTDLKAGSDEFQNLAERLATKGKLDKSRMLNGQALTLLSKYYLGRAREALRAKEWENALSAYQKLENEMRRIKERNDEINELESELSNARDMANKLNEGEKFARGGNFEQAYLNYREAFARADKLQYADTKEYIENRMKDFNYNPELYKEGMEKGIAVLEKPSPDLDEAVKSFSKALNNRPKDARAQMYLSYINDLKYCNLKNQSMYSSDRPHSSNPNFRWGGDERKTAFCIDRFEFPNIEGAQPKADISYVEAVKECRDAGKVLCSRLRWEDSCKISGLNAVYPYGNGKDADPSACNVDSEKVLPSGAKSSCKNALGVYDMSGNLAEWTLASDAEAENTQRVVKGGSYKNTASEARCDDNFTAAEDTRSAQIGFRCCRDLEEKK